MNSAARIPSIQVNSRNRPRNNLINVYDVNPNASPLAILNVNGVVINVRNAGTEIPGSSHLISTACDTISDPTMINAGAVAATGITPITGAITNANKNSPPVTIDVTPVRPPATTPAALST